MGSGSIYVRPHGHMWRVVYPTGRDDEFPTFDAALNVAQLFGRLDGYAVIIDAPPPYDPKDENPES